MTSTWGAGDEERNDFDSNEPPTDAGGSDEILIVDAEGPSESGEIRLNFASKNYMMFTFVQLIEDLENLTVMAVAARQLFDELTPYELETEDLTERISNGRTGTAENVWVRRVLLTSPLEIILLIASVSPAITSILLSWIGVKSAWEMSRILKLREELLRIQVNIAAAEEQARLDELELRRMVIRVLMRDIADAQFTIEDLMNLPEDHPYRQMLDRVIRGLIQIDKVEFTPTSEEEEAASIG
ncbi:hypothetical protein SAMN04487914_108101 [Arthrobacter sp. ok909]|uniref:hypothetical protein n=1 Tax=Arthrobacter sp. ok909 TaxID=1761746 RepID=UPI00088DB355|nr:hypothetical protein [Arthrobacter sp. ok909]SDP33453.1 hypothetical protein SAMN04487914_108101 [Arthrobacter sp. ok909]